MAELDRYREAASPLRSGPAIDTDDGGARLAQETARAMGALSEQLGGWLDKAAAKEGEAAGIVAGLAGAFGAAVIKIFWGG